MVRVGILGPTGYTGLELVRLLLRHPDAEIVYLGARREERPPISEVWPILRGQLDLRCSLLAKDPVPKMDLVFLALPHTLAMDHVPVLLEGGARVVDLGADYRLKDPADFKKWYKVEHRDRANLPQAAYGLSELFREEIKAARLVANPGCYATAIQLALAPLLRNRMAGPDGPIIADAKSGVSGAGRDPRPDLHFPEANESVSAYKVGVHQHTGEILQTVRRIGGRDLELLFVPHLIPMNRGILATCYAPLSTSPTTQELKDLYVRTYQSEPFVRVRTDDSTPTTKDVYSTNFCDMAVRAFGKTAVVISCIDNLVKGAAGQAVQNMNIMLNLPDTAGLLGS
jgi:N-acetyl-gamma-glutamyl-phosphate reductase